MNSSKTVNAVDSKRSGSVEENEDELYGADLSDEEILQFFLMDGCDVDGTPLQMLSYVNLAERVMQHHSTLH